MQLIKTILRILLERRAKMMQSKVNFSKRNWSKLRHLYRPTVEPIIFLCMAGISISSISFQSFVFERICLQWISEYSEKLSKNSTEHFTSFRAQSDRPSTYFLNESVWNGSKISMLKHPAFCKNHIKTSQFLSEHKIISAETSKVIFYRYHNFSGILRAA